MKRFQKFAAITAMAALTGTGIPAVAAPGPHDSHDRRVVQYAHPNHRDHRSDSRQNFRQDRDRGYVARYAPAPIPAPVYVRGYYDRGYYEEPSHNGRTAAIIGGSAAAGALIGAAADHGQGAIVGALIGGVVGVAASAAANEHGRY